MPTDSVQNCIDFFHAAKPNPTVKDVSTQIGVHFEEVREMIQTISPGHSDAAYYLNQAEHAIHALAELLKRDETAIGSVNRIEFLDALCDQMVTAVGSGHYMQMKMLGAFEEVNGSNHSKFEDGKPILAENGKIMKGKNYYKANLEPFV